MVSHRGGDPQPGRLLSGQGRIRSQHNVPFRRCHRETRCDERLFLHAAGRRDCPACRQYEEISLYDVVVHLDTEKAGSHPELLWADWAEASQITHREEITLQSPDGAEKDTILILSPSGSIEQLLSLHSKAGTVFPWPGPGEAIITRKLSQDLGLKIGDSAVLRLENGKTRSVLISGVCEYYVGHMVFAAPDGFADTAGNYRFV